MVNDPAEFVVLLVARKPEKNDSGLTPCVRVLCLNTESNHVHPLARLTLFGNIFTKKMVFPECTNSERLYLLKSQSFTDKLNRQCSIFPLDEMREDEKL